MNKLWLYEFMSRWLKVRYIYKILIVAFLGTHVPLLALIGYFIASTSPSLGFTLQVLAVALVATLLGTGVTLFVLTHLLRPVSLTSRGLRDYTTRKLLPQLPTGYVDEVGTLMADASHSLVKLDTTINYLGNYDGLTALPNRDSLLRELGERPIGTPPYALCVMVVRDLDRLQAAFGQEASNALLRDMVSRLEDAVGPQARLSRVEGNMFAYVLDDVLQSSDVAARTQRIHAALPAQYHIDSMRVVPEIATGIALYPGDALLPDSLLNNAISAAAAAEPIAGEQGAAMVGFFSSESRDQVRHRFTLEQELRHALDHDELMLHYQPVIDLTAGRVTGAEALLRWNHPRRGLVSPGEFIPVAEQSGLIDPMGLWVLQAACKQLQAWKGTALADMTVAINLSASQFLDKNLVAMIERTLQRNGIDASRLEIELTESAAMTDAKRTHRTLAALREMGVSTAIDDFGTGYSSMSYLKNLPFDKLKIDRAFVSGIETSRTSAAICKSMIELARGLGIAVLAEGTERREEVAYLADMGCGMFQGYFFARPAPAQALMQLVVDGQLAASMADFEVTRSATLWPAKPVERSVFATLH